MDRHTLSLAGKVALGALCVALVVHYWPTRGAGFAGGNVYLTCALVMCGVAVFAADFLIQEEGTRGIVKFVGTLGLLGFGANAFLF